MNLELIKRAYDSNAFTTAKTAAGYINPEYWDKQVMDHVRDNLVMLQLGVDKSSQLVDGDTLNVTIRAQPTVAAATAESAAATVVAFAPTQATISPSEYTSAYQITDKEMRRAFFDVMSTMVQDVGSAIADALDQATYTAVVAGAGNAIVADGVASSAITSTNTLGHDDIANAMAENATDKFSRHSAIVVHPYQQKALSLDSTFLTVDKFGADKAAARNGFVGSVFGVPVYVSTNVTLAANKAKALLISAKDSFAWVLKPQVGVRTEYHALERYTDIVGTADFGITVTRANAICTIESYAA